MAALLWEQAPIHRQGKRRKVPFLAMGFSNLEITFWPGEIFGSFAWILTATRFGIEALVGIWANSLLQPKRCLIMVSSSWEALILQRGPATRQARHLETRTAGWCGPAPLETSSGNNPLARREKISLLTFKSERMAR